MKNLRIILSMFLIVTLLTGDIATLRVAATVSENEAEEFVIENEIEESVTGNDVTIEVSGNDAEVTVSENSMEITVSDNETEANVEVTEISEEIQVIKSALREISDRKQIMAAIYLTDSYQARQEADGDSAVAFEAKSGQTVWILDVAVCEGAVWYRVGIEQSGIYLEGYIERTYLAYSDEELLQWEEEYLLPYLQKSDEALFNKEKQDATICFDKGLYSNEAQTSGYADIDAFPKSYWKALTELKKAYPNWKFVKLDTGLSWNDVINAQYGNKSWIYYTAPEEYKEGPSDTNWHYASKAAIAYYMDPRKHLNEKELFQFELLTYNASYHTVGALNSILGNTFMSGTIPGDNKTYAEAFLQLGQKYTISPFHLASRVIQEQGTAGTSPLISGTYPGYEGYYNYFNVGATGSGTDVIVNGLKTAKERGWNTRFKSLDGGSATVGNNYIKIGQDTLYLQKYQVVETSKGHALYSHQYMQNIQAPCTEGITMYRTYESAGSLNNSFVFKIPVYNNMPSGVGSVTLSETEHTLVMHGGNADSFTLIPTVTDVDGKIMAEYAVSWSSSNKKVATVENGVVTTVGPGTAVITVKADGKTAKCTVTVLAPIYKLEIIPQQKQLYVGGTVKLEARYYPMETTDSIAIRWGSSDETIATVENGLVTAKASGSATISAMIEGLDGTFVATCEITVKACEVLFHDDKGQKWKRVEVSYGETIGTKFPDETELPGHEQDVFSGWYTKPNGEGIRYDETTTVRQDVALYPHFISTQQDFFVKNVGDYVYTGEAIKPQVEVYDGNVKLVLNQDYTVSYANNKVVANTASAKVPTITVKGKGNYTGTQKVYFNILRKSIEDEDITAEDILSAYSGKVIKPSPVVYRAGKKLKKNTDYKISYPRAEENGAYRNMGVYPITIEGIKNYEGTRTVYLTISGKVLLSKVSVNKIPSVQYQEGKPIEPELVVKYKGDTLVASPDGINGDYTVTYLNQYEVGTATAVITATEDSHFIGTKTVTYKITGVPMKKAKITGVTKQEYSGEAITIFDKNGNRTEYFPEFSITYQEEPLLLGEHYTLSYSKNEEKGTATILFTGKGKFTGTVKKTFKITPYHVAENHAGRLRLAESDLGIAEFGAKGAMPDVMLYFVSGDGTEELLVKGVDYTLTYQNSRKLYMGSEDAAQPSVTIKGKGRFTGTWKQAATFEIGAKNLESTDITITAQDFVYQEGKEDYAPKLAVKDQGKALKLNQDYTIVSYEKVLTEDSGSMEYRAVIAGVEKENGDTQYTGTRTVSYRIYFCSIKQAVILPIPKQPYEDAAAKSEEGICPKPIVTYKIRSEKEAELFTRLAYEKYDKQAQEIVGVADGKALTLQKGDVVLLREDRDYMFKENSYQNNKQKGTAGMTIYGMGAFAGNKTAKFKIISRELVTKL